nr:hypothetical protein [uncultured Fluviicola sp.]
MKNLLFLLLFLLTVPGMAQRDTTNHIPQPFVYERADGASIYFLPASEFRDFDADWKTRGDGFTFYPSAETEENCPEGLNISGIKAKEKTYTYKIKACIFLTIKRDENQITVTEKTCPGQPAGCTGWGGVYLYKGQF